MNSPTAKLRGKLGEANSNFRHGKSGTPEYMPSPGRIYETMLAIAGHFEDIAYEIRMLAQEVRPDLPLRASPDLLARPIEDLEISVRSQNCLTTYGVKTIGDLVSLTKVEFRRIPHFGVKSRREVAEVVQNLGLRFGTLRP